VPVVLDVGTGEPWPAPAQTSEDDLRCQSLTRADLITCATGAQAAALQPWLARAGFAPGDEHLLIIQSSGAADPADAARLIATACEPLDHFCRHAFKRPAVAVAPEPRPAAPPSPPSKGFRQIWGEAAFHYRRGGARTLIVETLGYLQRKIANG
jgi:hypothetical protein